MSWFRARGLLDRTFEIGIILKGLDGVAETIGGLLLLFVSPARINRIAATVTQHELSEDPHDWIATHLLRYAHGLTNATVTFAAVYLLAHGIVKIILVGALLRNQMWAYPALLVVLIAFIVYQIYLIALHPTAGLVGLTVFDLAITALTWREWRRQRRLHEAGATAAEPERSRA